MYLYMITSLINEVNPNLKVSTVLLSHNVIVVVSMRFHVAVAVNIYENCTKIIYICSTSSSYSPVTSEEQNIRLSTVRYKNLNKDLNKILHYLVISKVKLNHALL